MTPAPEIEGSMMDLQFVLGVLEKPFPEKLSVVRNDSMPEWNIRMTGNVFECGKLAFCSFALYFISKDASERQANAARN